LDPNPLIESIPYFSTNTIQVDCLRLDQIHPIVSGNKWYKLRFYIQAAIESNATTIASFGGPYSNHLVALAFVAKQNGLKSKGYVRSNQGEPVTPSLQEAIDYGMDLVYLGRTHFQERKNDLLNEAQNETEVYFVDEGGYGSIGAKGASTIFTDWNRNHENKLHSYDTLVCAVGTGTMIAGMINAIQPHQKIIGIPVLKNEESIGSEIQELILNPHANFELLHSFHQGGYAKTSAAQIEFMNAFWNATKIPTDIVYTGKVFYAVQQLLNNDYFLPNSKVLIMHSGGLQGNRSLAKEALNF
jgi:1-aminocyclopropane-1-carboxylate deaminase